MFIAHASHWLVNAVYAGPVVVVVGWLAITTLLERRRAGRDDAPPKENS